MSLSVSVFAEGKYCGSINSDVYHYPDCQYVKEIKPENLIWFQNETDAVRHGYRPCQVCKPPNATLILANTTLVTSSQTTTTT